MSDAGSEKDIHITEGVARFVQRYGNDLYLREMIRYLRQELGWSELELSRFEALASRGHCPRIDKADDACGRHSQKPRIASPEGGSTQRTQSPKD
jgi:hypothetical protein